MMRAGRMTLVMALVVVAGALACTDLESPVDLEPDSIWEASLAPSGVPDPEAPIVTGQAAAVVQSGRTEIGIQMNGLQDSVQWALFEDSCRGPGALVGSIDDYPPLSPDTASAETQLTIELRPTDSYNVRVGPDIEGGSVIACGELEQREEV